MGQCGPKLDHVRQLIPIKLYKLTNDEFHSAASVCLGIPNPVCIPHIGTSLVRRASEEAEDDDDADRARRGDTVDAFGFTVSARVQQGAPWKGRHDQFADRIAQMMQFSGVPARAEPRNVMNRHVPERLLRDATQGGRAYRMLQGAIPYVAYTDPMDGKEKIAELKFINMCPSRYDSGGDKPTCRCEQA